MHGTRVRSGPLLTEGERLYPELLGTKLLKPCASWHAAKPGTIIQARKLYLVPHFLLHTKWTEEQ